MARKYSYEDVNLSDLLLDAENPRFASSFYVKDTKRRISQESIIDHLLKYAQIVQIAKRINEVGELHGSEVITCYKQDSSYIVIEGNRRVCACKLLLNRDLIPDDHKSTFPFASDETLANIRSVSVIVYPDRESVQAYLSDRHITGVKKWSAREKNNYYMNLFQQVGDIEKVKSYTSDSLAIVKKSITKYQFFMDVFRVLQGKYVDIEIEKLNYLPLVDRFMDILVSNDKEVGLNLTFDEKKLNYFCVDHKKDIYQQILMLVGEAFLIVKDKIKSMDISNIEKQKSLILKDKKIPGLIKLINDYKGHNITTDISDATDTRDIEEENEKGDDNCNDEADDNTNVFIPQVIFTPKIQKKTCLWFTLEEAKNFNIYGDSDIENKINWIIFDLTKLSVYKHPYSCVFLYRTLIEISTKLVFDRHLAKKGREYNKKDLAVNINHLCNNFLFKDAKIRVAIKTLISRDKLIDILNNYIHESDPVDESLLLSTWNTMKLYIKACLEQ